MTTIRSLSNHAEAGFLLSLLKANGFDAVLLDEGSFQYGKSMQPIRLQVADEQAKEAIIFLSTPHELDLDAEDTEV
jgi:hypothetical protein